MIKGAGIILFSSLMLLLLVIPFPGEADQLDTSDLGGRLVRIGVLARRGSEECLRSWEPTADYLGRQTKDSRFQIVPLTFEEVVPRVQAKDVDFVIVNSSIYVELEALFGATRIATMKGPAVDYESTVFGGVIFSRADRLDIESVNDLKGKSFMGVDETSLGGWRASWREFKAKGIDPYKDFSKLLFSGTHDAVVYAVRDGKVDAGTVATPILEQMAAEGKIEFGFFRVINAQKHADFPYVHSTRLYPNWPFAKVKDTPNALAEKILIALLLMPHDSPAAIASGVGGWTVPLDYGSVDECLRELRIGIYKDFGKITVVDVLHNYKWQIVAALLAITGLTGLLFLALRLNLNLRTSKLALQNQIYEREHAEAALEKITEQHELILISAGEGIIGIDLEGIITFANPAARKTLGYEEEELIGKDLHLTIHHTFADGTHYPVTECPMYAALNDGISSHIRDEVLWRKDGTSFSSAYSARPIIEHGKITGAVVTFRDITKRKQAEDALRDSELRLRTILQTAHEGFWLIDIDSVTMDLNPRMCGILGRNREEVLGRKIFDFVDDENRAILEQQIKLRVQGKPGEYEIALSRPDGSHVFCHFSATPLFEESGKMVGLFAMVTDITERKRAEEERMRLITAIEQASEGICICDTNWLICYVNPVFGHMSGYDRTDLIGQHMRILKSGKHDKTFYRNIREPLSRGEAWSGRLTNKRKDGTLYEVECTASPIRNISGEIISYVAIHRDITHQVKLEAELHQARKMEAIGLLAGGIAHDFNNILAAIMGFTELSLLKIPEGSPVRRNLEQVLKAASRASGVVKQILTFTRKGMQERKPVRIALIVQEALKLLRSSLPSTIEIRQELAVRPCEDVVLADPGQIHQVLMNLSTNAGHAMRAKGGTLTVKLSVITDASQLSVHPDLKAEPHVCITVSDTGHGMDLAVVERIFDPYFTTKGPGEGTGLGLSVVQGIVNSHGGAVTVRSEPGQGTTFSVFLPRLEDVNVADAKASEALPTGSERILLVDDEESLVELGKEILETLGYHVTAKTSSLDALETFRAQPDAFDLVITDMTMPSLTGRELAEKIIALRPDTPIILSTGFSDPVNEKQAKEAGIREFVMKPYEIRTLAGAIRKALEHSSS